MSRSLSLPIMRRLARLWPDRTPRSYARDTPRGRPRVLVTGIYVANKANTADHLVTTFASQTHVDVEQRWAAMKGPPPTPAVAAVTIRQSADYVPKWMMLNDLIGPDSWRDFDYILFCDDDILVSPDFLDRFIALQQAYGFDLAQPARTWASYTDWPIVRRRLFTRARQTSFVEGGPMVSMSRAFLELALPFSEESPMGWGYDLVWPKVAEKVGMTLGIVDATPVDHSLRARGALYDDTAEIARMAAYLSTRDHIRTHETFRTFR